MAFREEDNYINKNRKPHNPKSSKYVNDPIHGYMEFDDWVVDFIDTPQFQRLRDIKQLGSTYFVFPGASHNRFEHSLGTAHLANSLVKRLFDQQQHEQISSDDIKCVTLAALCHDLGHGPFSHVFDNTVVPKLFGEWRHEVGSEMMLEYLLEENSMDFDEKDVKIIKDLITGEVTDSKRSFIFDIVANKRNSIDVDKFDYLERDCYYLGMKSKFEFTRLMNFSKVIDDQITYLHKEYFNISDMFHTRYSLHKRVYNHRVSKSIDHMIADALVKANPIFRFTDVISNREEYLKLTDGILYKIEYSNDPELEESRKIIKNLRYRKLYKFVDECLIPAEYYSHVTEKHLNELEIVSHQTGDDPISVEDVIVDRVKMNYGKGNQNPLDSVKFYGKYSKDNDAFCIESSEVAYLVPEKYEEEIVRVFSRDPEKVRLTEDTYRNCLTSHLKQIYHSRSNQYNTHSDH
ncbi:353_t:CDS:10 [Acaulospora morrowiae]|uniref:353_t:CDS:1 n=1 Tax=Acaulospora morrowiae TaxID=94023 RepID=A0A9N8VE01_9GLOM|nr:353_t:CDS:10 [Acaulospora morrowiae]